MTEQTKKTGATPANSAARLRAKGTGTHEFRNGHHWVKVSLPDKTRPRYALGFKQPLVDGRCATCDGMGDAMIAERSQAISERKRAELAQRLAGEQKARQERRLTVQQFGELWTSGKLLERHGDVNGLRQRKSAKLDGHRLAAYAYSEIGKTPMADITEEDIERVMAAAERKARKKYQRPWCKVARFQLYQVLRRRFELAIRPGRLRADSPVSEYVRPGRDDPKLFGFLYPSDC